MDIQEAVSSVYSTLDGSGEAMSFNVLPIIWLGSGEEKESLLGPGV